MPSLPPPEDLTLIGAYQKAAPAEKPRAGIAIDASFRPHARRIAQTFFRATPYPHLAEDAEQVAMAQFFALLETGQDIPNPGARLATMAKCRCIDLYRREKARPTEPILEDMGQRHLNVGSEFESDIEDELLGTIDRLWLQPLILLGLEVVAKVNEDHAMALAWWFHGLSHAELARMRGVDANTPNVWKNRGLATFTAWIKEQPEWRKRYGTFPVIGGAGDDRP